MKISCWLNIVYWNAWVQKCFGFWNICIYIEGSTKVRGKYVLQKYLDFSVFCIKMSCSVNSISQKLSEVPSGRRHFGGLFMLHRYVLTLPWRSLHLIFLVLCFYYDLSQEARFMKWYHVSTESFRFWNIFVFKEVVNLFINFRSSIYRASHNAWLACPLQAGSHVNTSLCPDCTTFLSAPCLGPGTAAENGPKPWHPAPVWET